MGDLRLVERLSLLIAGGGKNEVGRADVVFIVYKKSWSGIYLACCFGNVYIHRVCNHSNNLHSKLLQVPCVYNHGIIHVCTCMYICSCSLVQLLKLQVI